MDVAVLKSNNPFDQIDDNKQDTAIICNADDILKCESLKRIQLILHDYDNHQNKEFDQDYSNVSILNDFFHLKHHLNVHKDHDKFDNVYKHLTKNLK